MGETDARFREDVKDVAIRDAATIILVRDPETSPKVLMGQRGRAAAFMADKFVFPGGAVDADDTRGAAFLEANCRQRLNHRSSCPPEALAAAALRELHEETGQKLDPSASGLRFFFRAITPPGRPRRFDARFFLNSATALTSDPDHFEPSDAELSHLQWVPLPEVRKLNLPFITRIVLGELEQHLPRMDAPDRLAFVSNEDDASGVEWL